MAIGRLRPDAQRDPLNKLIIEVVRGEIGQVADQGQVTQPPFREDEGPHVSLIAELAQQHLPAHPPRTGEVASRRIEHSVQGQRFARRQHRRRVGRGHSLIHQVRVQRLRYGPVAAPIDHPQHIAESRAPSRVVVEQRRLVELAKSIRQPALERRGKRAPEQIQSDFECATQVIRPTEYLRAVTPHPRLRPRFRGRHRQQHQRQSA